MAQRKHSVPYRLWNQTREAMHLESWFSVWDVLQQECAIGTRLSGSYPLLPIHQTLYQSMIVHIDFMTTKRGVGLVRLYEEALEAGFIGPADKAKYDLLMASVSGVLKNVSMQRNNIVAHRSESLSFADVKQRYPVDRNDLARCIDVYGKISRDAFRRSGGFRSEAGLITEPWETQAAVVREQTEAMRHALMEPAVGPQPKYPTGFNGRAAE